MIAFFSASAMHCILFRNDIQWIMLFETGIRTATIVSRNVLLASNRRTINVYRYLNVSLIIFAGTSIRDKTESCIL